MSSQIEALQQAVCAEHGSQFVPPADGTMIGVSKDLFDKKPPINGLRHSPEGHENGWFFWTGGEIPNDPGWDSVCLHEGPAAFLRRALDF
jgi:hypothetical protein